VSHDTFNASSTATWIECSWSALNAVPEPPKKASTAEAADAGTAKHTTMEGGGIPEVEAFLAQLEGGGIMVREARVRLTDDCGGTVDIFNDSLRVATILDAKFGKWDVPAKHNKQLMTYAACLLPMTRAEWWRFVIYQPNGLDEKPWKQWIHHRSEIEAHRERVLRAVADRSAPRPGPWCRWCNAFQACPAMATDAGFLIGAMSRRIEDLTPDEIVRMLRMIRALGDVKDVYEEALTVKLKLGYTAEGATLKPGRSFRSWNDQEQAATVLYQQFGVRGVKPVSPAQAEKLGPAGKQYAVVGAHKPEADMKASY
jgi:Protein of unknown function (DUF2800)